MADLPLFVRLQYLLPKQALTRLAGWAAEARGGWLTTAFIRWFIRRYQVEMNEAANPDPASYPSFNAFFTRPLRDDVRPQAPGDCLLMPVDGAISALGPIASDQIFQAKGHHYSTQALLGGDAVLAQPFANGSFATIYLSPRDYHRIHLPLAGTLRTMVYVPGELFSVNPVTVAHVPGLFARNERLVTIWDTAVGPMALVLVGATIVGSIETVWAGTVTPPRGTAPFTWHYPSSGSNAVQLDRGAEMGRFKLGSTVVLLFGEAAVSFAHHLEAATPVRLNQCFAYPGLEAPGVHSANLEEVDDDSADSGV